MNLAIVYALSATTFVVVLSLASWKLLRARRARWRQGRSTLATLPQRTGGESDA